MAQLTPPTIQELQKRFGASNVKDSTGNVYAVVYVDPKEDRRALAKQYAHTFGGKVDTSTTWTGKAVLFPNGKRLSFKPRAGSSGSAKAQDGELILSQFKPSHIPGVCNAWLTPDQMYGKVATFILGPHFPGTAKIAYYQFLKELTHDQKLSFTLPVMPPDVSSELFEVLLGIKLARLLANNDARVKAILGLTTKAQ
jgi:hypothetical protein